MKVTQLQLTSLWTLDYKALFQVKRFIQHQLSLSQFSSVLKDNPAEGFFRMLVCMLRGALLSVVANFVLMLLRTTNFKMSINVLMTAPMVTLKVSTTTVSPLSSATPLAAAHVNSKIMLPNAQLAVQL